MAKKPAAKKKSKPTRKASAPKAKSAARIKARPKPRKAAKESSIGRPKITGEEPLYLVFKEDYHARQVFEFLRVNTVKELELLTPDDILKRLTQPVRITVERIRRALANHNRCLAGDQRFVVEVKKEQAGH